MKYVEYGVEKEDVIILLHGGGLAPWNYYKEAAILKDKYHIVIPVLDGHNESHRNFISIEENARSIIAYIDENFGGKVLFIGGLSLGGQILVEILSKRKDICRFAIIESALVIPMKTTNALIKPAFSLCYPLVKRRWFARLQFASMHINEEFFEEYYQDSAAITKENLTAFLAANSNYKIKDNLTNCQAKVQILVGGKESTIMKKSAEIIHRQIPDSSMEIIQGYHHGDLSINYPQIYTQKVIELIGK